jgi:hypothetical protein
MHRERGPFWHSLRRNDGAILAAGQLSHPKDQGSKVVRQGSRADVVRISARRTPELG